MDGAPQSQQPRPSTVRPGPYGYPGGMAPQGPAQPMPPGAYSGQPSLRRDSGGAPSGVPGPPSATGRGAPAPPGSYPGPSQPGITPPPGGFGPPPLPGVQRPGPPQANGVVGGPAYPGYLAPPGMGTAPPGLRPPPVVGGLRPPGRAVPGGTSPLGAALPGQPRPVMMPGGPAPPGVAQGSLQPPPMGVRPGMVPPIRAPPAFGSSASVGPPPPPGMYPPRPGMKPGGAGVPNFSGGPPPPYAPGAGPNVSAPGFGGATPQRALDPFEAITLAAPGPGQPAEPDAGNPQYFPRPAGPGAAAAVAAPPPVYPGNCEARFMRPVVAAIPAQQALRARFQLPIGALVQPLADPQDVPVLGLGSHGIVRCKRCRTYINPFVTWRDAGRVFACNVCGAINDVPVEYCATLDAEGRPVADANRPELSRGSVEYVAPAEYMVRPPMPPSFFFLIDVSAAAVATGALPVVCATIKRALEHLPGGERTQIGLLTFDSTLHFYNLKASLSQPQMLVVSDLEEPFLPLPDDMLVNLAESRSVVEALLDSIPATFAANTVVDSCLGPALQAAFLVISPIGGKLLLFQAAAPSLGVGRVKQRDNPALWGSDQEYKLRCPEDPFWKKLAAECSRVQIAIDVFALGAGYMDLASLGTLPKYTCGHLYFHPNFAAPRDGHRLANELGHNLTRLTGWEAVMRIRCSRSLRISNFHGNFFIRSTDLLALPQVFLSQVDPDKAFAVQIAHEEAVVQEPVAYVQCALLYTSSNGERRIRVHTMALPVVAEMGDLYRATDAGATACLLMKLALEKTYHSKLEETRTAIQHKLGIALREYRMLHQTRGTVPHHKLLLPPQLRCLPLWTLGIIKCAALRGGARDVGADERAAVGLEAMSAPTPLLLRLIHPALYPVHDPAGDWGKPAPDGRVALPTTAPLTLMAMDPAGAYLLDTLRIFVLWLGRNVSPDFLAQALGVNAAAGMPDPLTLAVEPARPGLALSARINAVLGALRAGRPNYPACFVVQQGTPSEVGAAPYFVEDRGPGTPSYADFLAGLQKAVLTKS